MIEDGTPVKVTGTIVAIDRHITVLDVSGERLNVVLPSRWVVNYNITSLANLFETGRLRIGQKVTIRAMKLIVGNVYTLLGYQIISGFFNTTAFLPFNVVKSR